MSRLTKAQRFDIEQALYDVERAIEYLKQPNTVVCMVHNHPATNTGAYSSHDRLTSISPVSIEIGSDIVGMYKCRDTPRGLLLKASVAKNA